MRPEMRDIIKKIHKKRGYKFASIQEKPVIINIMKLQAFPDGTKVSPKFLVEKKLIQGKSGKIPSVKVLGSGDIKNKLIFSGFLFSKEAKVKIEKAGGSIK